MWPLFFLFFLIPHPIFAANYSSNASTTITATINENRVTIFGYTSPNSRVELSNVKIFAATYSDPSGYFLFDKTLIPKSTADLCLVSTDNSSRQTTPTCFPSPPLTNYQTNIGPILLPPTISLEEDNINPNTTVITSGQSIPNSQVSLSFYKVSDGAKSFVKSAYAYSLPSITATTDKSGNFSLTLPTAYSSDYRLYASAKFNDNYSPKSNTLIYILPSLFYLFLQQYPFIKFLLPLLILTLIVFFYLLHLQKPKSSKFLPAIRNFFPTVRRISPAITVCQTKPRQSK
ncbi:MAG: hypothetical protein KIH89_003310 [Candidatus Shapirobacteria bacterium]|nr:hypothetical protein [Candidatus Shapirobacteria bacterium]